MSKKSPKPAKKAPAKSLRWSLGLYRTAKGKLAAVYVRADGSVVPYLQRRVGSAKILFHKVYNGITYSAARAQLVKESKLKDQKGAAPAKKAAQRKAA